MKTKLFIALFLLSSLTFGQPFKFSDTTFVAKQFLPLWEIYFDFAKPSLQTRPQLQLDSLADFLIKNKSIKVEIGVHTDFRGDDKWNLDLSKKRAATLEQYLINKGVDKSKLVAIGFGETKPIIEYEDMKKITDTHRCGYYGRTNRRVTAVIL